MQELRFVLIIVGALAIAALLFHGLWTSRKDGKAKFSNKPLGKLKNNDATERPSSNKAFFNTEEDDEEVRVRKEPAFSFDAQPNARHLDPLDPEPFDPLFDGYKNNDTDVGQPSEESDFAAKNSREKYTDYHREPEPHPVYQSEPEHFESHAPDAETVAATVEPQASEDEFDVIVLNVHCAGRDPFVGTRLFDSMKQNGLLYGEMDIFHRHEDLSGTGKVLFSVANMMQPGTLKHDDPDEFTTKGISFFMTLPGFGDPDQNFKIMLRTAQQIADDMGGNVLDERRNLITPDRLAQYRHQIKEFKARIA